MMAKAHTTDGRLLDDVIRVLLIGAGGTGGQVACQLARLHTALLALGHPGGLHVTIVDGDEVSSANIGRQNFYAGDVGQNKAECLVNRLNLCFGTNWRACVEYLEDSDNLPLGTNIVIGCVDSRKARRTIKTILAKSTLWSYYFDCGNSSTNSQVLLGTNPNREKGRLPLPFEVAPELIAEGIEDNSPSCSLAEALAEQDLMVNQITANWALQMLWSLFRHGGLDYHGVFINLETGQVRSLPIPTVIGS